MSHFKTSLNMTAVAKGWVLNERFIYYSDLLSREIVVPKSFFTDLASVPRIMRWLVPVANAKNRRAAVVHDLLCHRKYQLYYGINQRQADAVFREALEVCGVSKIGCYGMWLPVRVFQEISGWFK
jgi:hypothetical protein